MEQVAVGSGADGISFAAVVRFLELAVDALNAAREEIDALNVYPVPDGDTGTNMFLTVSAARDELNAAIEAGADEVTALKALARGALLGARGNSGVILSQMLTAMMSRAARAEAGSRNAEILTAGLEAAAAASYEAVGTPVEGTILTVAKAASVAARATCADPAARSADVFSAAAKAARQALALTPQQLKVLADAGVVDAGGRGLCVILDAAETALTGRVHLAQTTPGRLREHTIPMPTPGALPGSEADRLTADGPAYEVMYLLDADEKSVAALRRRLAALGDSLVVVGGDRLWNVHVHVDDVGAAIEAGIEAGRPYRIRVTHFAEQVAAARDKFVRAGRGVVAVSAGPGLTKLFEEAGATVVSGGPGRRPSAAELLAAITASSAAEVTVLPNDADSVRVAQIAARTAEKDHGIRVAVIPTKAQVQGLAAMAVHEPGRSFDADVLEMTATSGQVRQGAVTLAVRDAMTMAGPCQAGDALGVIAGDFAVVADDEYEAGTQVLSRLLGGGGELVTLVAGDQPHAGDLSDRMAAWLESTHPHLDVVQYDGGQDRYSLLISVE